MPAHDKLTPPPSSPALRRAALCAGIALSACHPSPPPAPPSPAALRVASLSQPAAWLVSEVGGSHVEVQLIPPPGEDPPVWAPSPEVIAGLRQVDLIVAVGAGYEAWTAMATLPDDKMFAMADGIEPIVLAGTSHSHGGKAEHSHAGVDPHLWTDPTQVAAAARRLADRLAPLLPAQAEVLRQNASVVQRAAGDLDLQLAAATQPLQGRPLLANHPSFNYLARRYHLSLETIDLDPATPPSPEQRARVDAWLQAVVNERPRAEAHPLLLWEAAPAPPVVAALPAGLQHAVLDPAEQPGPSGRYDWPESMRRTADALARSSRGAREAE